MMAKRRENRYKNIEELLRDLEALRNGQPPLQAHKRFDVSMFEQLEKGEVVEQVKEKVYQQETLANYRMAVLVLSAVAAAFFLVILLLLLLRR